MTISLSSLRKGSSLQNLADMQAAYTSANEVQQAEFKASVSGDAVYLRPSGDVSGVADAAAYYAATAALPAAGGEIIMAPGVYYTNTPWEPGTDNVRLSSAVRWAAKLIAITPWVTSANLSATAVLSITGRANCAVDGVWVDLYTNGLEANGIEVVRDGLIGAGNPSTNCVVSNNRVEGPPVHSYLIWSQNCTGTKIFGNYVDGKLPTRQTGAAATQEGIEVYAGSDIDIYDNTVVNCGANGIYVYTNIAQVLGGVVDGVRVFGNRIDRCMNGVNIGNSKSGSNDGYVANVVVDGNTINRCWSAHIIVDFPVVGGTMRNIEITNNVGVGATTAEGAIAGVKAFIFNNQLAGGKTAITLDGKFLVADNAFTGIWTTDSGGALKIYNAPGGEYRGNTWGLAASAGGTSRGTFMYYSSGVRQVNETVIGGRYWSSEYIGSSGFSVTGALYKDWNGAESGQAAVIVQAGCTDFTFADCSADTSTPTNIASMINLGSTGIRRFEVRGLRYLNTANNRGSIGQVTFNADTVWAANTSYPLMSSIRPTTGGSFYYQCIVSGASGATEPTWPTSVGATVVSGAATFVCRSVWE